MGRVYDVVKVNGKNLYTIFDPGAVHSYTVEQVARKAKLKLNRLKKPFRVGLGGEKRLLKRYCVIEGELQGHHFFIAASTVRELGFDEKGNKIELLFGAHDMQTWNIQLDLKNEKLDLSRFRKEFIEY